LTGIGATAGIGSWWIGASHRRGPRWARQTIADTRRNILPAPVRPSPQNWSDNEITLCWLGHATVLINFYGIRILTDPALGNRIGVSLGFGTVGPKRYIAPALGVRELPPIDLLLLSHAHMDHMDLPSLERFDGSTLTVTAMNTSDVLRSARLKKIVELPWNGQTTVRTSNGEVRIEAFEVRHGGRRWPSEINRGYNGYVLRREGKAILFAGDTAHTRLFSKLSPRGPFEAAVMPIGAYQPWIWNHCTPEEAVEMMNWAGARYIVPVHHQTFRLSNEPMTEPLERLDAALQGEPERLALRRIGEHFVCPKV
jgi:L-ascorbate metabolism protein UlaG (beta-lactamase superfamily)